MLPGRETSEAGLEAGYARVLAAVDAALGGDVIPAQAASARPAPAPSPDRPVLPPAPDASTLSGSRRSSAQQAGSKLWQKKSPMGAVPKSQKSRQVTGV